MSKNTTKDLRGAALIAEYEAGIAALEERDSNLRSLVNAPERAAAEVRTAKQRRVDLKAEAMAQGKIPDTTQIDAEIAATIQAEADAIEASRAAQAAREHIRASISELEGKISAAKRDLRISGLERFADRNAALRRAEADANRRAQEAASEAMEAEIARRENAIDYIIGKAECGIRSYEELAPLLEQRIGSLSAAPRRNSEIRSITAAGVVNFDRVPEELRDDAPRVKIRDMRNREADPDDPNALNDILRRMEVALMPAAPFAEIAAEVFNSRETKLEMLKILRLIAAQVRRACKECGVTVPEWAFAGDSSWRTWTREAEKEPICQFLRNAGIEC